MIVQRTRWQPWRLLLACLLLLSTLLLGTSTQAQAQPAGQPVAHVILLDWDGFDPDYLGRVPMPNLEALMRHGSLSIARGTFHTISNPSRASTSTGAYPEVHNNAAYYFDPASNRARGQERFLAAETIAQSLADSGKTIASVQWYMVQNYGTAYGNPTQLYVQPGGSFERRVDAAIDILHRRPVNSGGVMVTVPKIPDFLAVYSSDLDGMGHRVGPDDPAIAELLAEHDRQLGRLIEATRELGIYGRTTFILTADHGMTGWNRSLDPQVLQSIAAAGYSAEIVPVGRSPQLDSEVVIVPSVRLGDITLRGRAATPEGRQAVQAALESLPEIARVLDEDDLRQLRASPKLGDLVAEARPPYAFTSRVDHPPGEMHGGHGSLAEIEVPLLLAGAGIKPGALPQNPGLVDIAPTIAALLDARPPAQAQGRVLEEALLPVPGRP